MGVGRGPGIPEAQSVTVGGREVQGVRELVGGGRNQSVTPGRDVPRACYYKEEKNKCIVYINLLHFIPKLFQKREQNNTKVCM